MAGMGGIVKEVVEVDRLYCCSVVLVVLGCQRWDRTVMYSTPHHLGSPCALLPAVGGGGELRQVASNLRYLDHGR